MLQFSLNPNLLTPDPNDCIAVTKLSILVENKPARLMAMIPVDLPQGNYTLEVKASAISHKPLKTHKRGVFNKQLVVL